MSRLDRLFTLLSSSSSPTTRQLAAKQLGEVQKLHPHDLHQLLSRIHSLLRSSSWETRWDLLRVSEKNSIAASKAVAAVIKEVSPVVEETSLIKDTEVDLPSPSWDVILAHGQQFEMENDRQEEEVVSSTEDQLFRINSDFGFEVASKLGFANAKDLVSEDDLKIEVSSSTPQLSAREKNSLRRKLKTQLKRTRSQSDECSSAKIQRTSFQPPPVYSRGDPYEEASFGDFHLNSFCEFLELDLFSQKWEIRHGAATALREILKEHGKSLGKLFGASVQDNHLSNIKFLLNISTKLLWLISSDRFADYGSSEVVAPVRETTSMALGVIFQLIPKSRSEWIVSMLLKMLKSNDWQTRHGGTLGLKYYLAFTKGLNLDLTMHTIYPAIIKLFSDDADDLVGAAANALFPIVKLIIENRATIKPDLVSLVSQLSSILTTLDDISSSTQSVMKLICILLTSISSELDYLLPVEHVLTLVRRIVSFLNHPNDVVKSSAIQTLSAAIKCASKFTGFMSNVTPLLLPHIYQFALLENNEESLEVAKKVWFDVCDLCPLEPLLLAGCPVYGSWFTLIQRPPNFPLPAELLIPNDFSHDPLYLGGRAALHANSDQDRGRLMMKARCLGAKLLGKLACKVSTPVPGAEQVGTVSSPIDMFTERVLMPCLETKSAYQHIATALVIIFWSELEPEQCKNISQNLKDKILMLLAVESHYEEFLESMNDFTMQLSSLRSKLVKTFYCQTLESSDFLTIDINQLATTTSPISPEVLKELNGEQKMLQTIYQKIQLEENLLSVVVKGLLASALVSIGAIPQKLNPLIRPIMESIKREKCGEIMSIVTRNLAKLLDLCIINNNLQPTEKAVRNLMHFAASNPTIAARINQDAEQIELGIISQEQSLECENDKRNGKKSHEPEENVHKTWAQYHGASQALRAIVSHFGTSLFDRLPIFNDLTIKIVQNHQNASLKDLIIALKTLEVCAMDIHVSLSYQLQNIASIIVGLLCHKSVLIRHLASRCLVAFVLISEIKMSVISLVVNEVLEYLGSELVHHRQGGMECIAAIVEGLGTDVVPFIILIVLSVLRRMSDQDPVVRQVASGTFATLIKLIPLDSSSSDEIHHFPESLRIKKQEDRKFVQELMNIKSVQEFHLDFRINAELRSYQKEGINWLSFLGRYGLHGILCDDMGLGKTLQSICILSGDHMKRRREYQTSCSESSAPLPSLVICPSTLCGHWKGEIENFVEKSVLTPFVFYGSIQTRMDLRTPLNEQLKKSDNLVVISSYDVIRNDIDFFKEKTWNYIILDEGHSIRNSKAKTTKAVKALNGNHRIILSGTPIQNTVLELWSLFDFLMPGFLGTERQFNSRFARPIVACRGTGPGNVSKECQEAGALAVEALHRQVLPFVLRRVKDDVLKDLPPKITQDYYCELSPIQVLLYENYVKKEASVVTDNKESDEKKLKVHVFQLLQYLRKVCNHPKLVLTEDHPQYTEITKMLSDNKTSMDSLTVAAKLPALKQLLHECNIGVEKRLDEMSEVVNQHRILLFCQLKSMMDIVENDLLKSMQNVTYLRMDGSVPAACRMDLVKRFNTDPSIDIFLLSTSVGGLGLNLTGADTVIFVEHDWNPMKDLQAMDRAHRIGQKKVVNVYRLITRNTIEEKILGLQKFKLKTANTVISNENSSLESMGKDEIFDLFSLNEPSEKPKRESGHSGSGLKSILENLPDLFDERLYEEEYDVVEKISSD